MIIFIQIFCAVYLLILACRTLYRNNPAENFKHFITKPLITVFVAMEIAGAACLLINVCQKIFAK